MKRRELQDIEISKRLRALRVERGMTQSTLAQALGVTFQQVQKYENALNRISSGRLQIMAGVFEVPITYFFSGDKQSKGKPPEVDFYFGRRDEVPQLVQAYLKIRSSEVKRAIVRLAERLASGIS